MGPQKKKTLHNITKVKDSILDIVCAKESLGKTHKTLM